VKSILTKTIITDSLIKNLYRRYEHYLNPHEDLNIYHIQILWDGKDEKGDFVQDGRFYFTVFASLINEKIEGELKEEQRKILDDIIKVIVSLGSKNAKIEITKSFSVSGAKISAELPEKKVEFEINQKKDSEYEIKGEVVSQELLENLKNLLSSLSSESRIRVDIIESEEYPQYGEVAVDNTPPVSIVFVGDPKYESGSDVFVTPKTPIKIFAQDNIAGSDGASVFVELGAEQIYLGNFNEFMLELPDGKYTLLYRAEDKAGNVEEFRTLKLNLDSTPPDLNLNISWMGDKVLFEGNLKDEVPVAFVKVGGVDTQISENKISVLVANLKSWQAIGVEAQDILGNYKKLDFQVPPRGYEVSAESTTEVVELSTELPTESGVLKILYEAFDERGNPIVVSFLNEEGVPVETVYYTYHPFLDEYTSMRVEKEKGFIEIIRDYNEGCAQRKQEELGLEVRCIKISWWDNDARSGGHKEILINISPERDEVRVQQSEVGETIYKIDRASQTLRIESPIGTKLVKFEGEPEVTSHAIILPRVLYEVDENGNVKRYFYDETGEVYKIVKEKAGPNGEDIIEQVIHDIGKRKTFIRNGVEVMKIEGLWDHTHRISSYGKIVAEIFFDIKPDSIRQRTVIPGSIEVIRDFDNFGNIVKDVKLDKDGNIIENLEWSYDLLGRLVRYNFNGRIIEYEYDAEGRIISVKENNRVTVQYSYFDGGFKINFEDLAIVQAFEKPGFPNLVKYEGVSGKVVQYQTLYSIMDDVLAEVRGDAGWSIFTYDETGRVKRIEKPEGEFTEFEYDQMGRITTLRFKDETVRFFYDGQNPLNEVVSGGKGNETGAQTDDFKVAISYNKLGMVSGEKLQIKDWNYSTKYKYDINGNLVGIEFFGSPKWAELEYRDDGTILYSGREVFTEGYFSGQYGNSVSFEASRIGSRKGIIIYKSGTEAISEQVVEQDIRGNTTSISKKLGDEVKKVDYKYDRANRLLEWNSSDGLTQTIKYDEFGNRTYTKYVDGSKTKEYIYQYEPDNRLTLIKDTSGKEVAAYEYDTAGRVAQFVDFLNDTGFWMKYKRELLGEVRIEDSFGTEILASYSYDSEGRRVLKSIKGPNCSFNLYYVWDRGNLGGNKILSERVVIYSGQNKLYEGSKDFVWSSGKLVGVKEKLKNMSDSITLCAEAMFTDEDGVLETFETTFYEPFDNLKKDMWEVLFPNNASVEVKDGKLRMYGGGEVYLASKFFFKESSFNISAKVRYEGGEGGFTIDLVERQTGIVPYGKLRFGCAKVSSGNWCIAFHQICDSSGCSTPNSTYAPVPSFDNMDLTLKIKYNSGLGITFEIPEINYSGSLPVSFNNFVSLVLYKASGNNNVIFDEISSDIKLSGYTVRVSPAKFPGITFNNIITDGVWGAKANSKGVYWYPVFTGLVTTVMFIEEGEKVFIDLKLISSYYKQQMNKESFPINVLLLKVKDNTTGEERYVTLYTPLSLDDIVNGKFPAYPDLNLNFDFKFLHFSQVFSEDLKWVLCKSKKCLKICAPEKDTFLYTHNDIKGVPWFATDEGGKVVWKRELSPFGELVSGNHRIPLALPGMYYDFETGFFYNVARYYDPFSGRYLQPDITRDANLYVYARNNPERFYDPFGLFEVQMTLEEATGMNLPSKTLAGLVDGVLSTVEGFLVKLRGFLTACKKFIFVTICVKDIIEPLATGVDGIKKAIDKILDLLSDIPGVKEVANLIRKAIDYIGDAIGEFIWNAVVKDFLESTLKSVGLDTKLNPDEFRKFQDGTKKLIKEVTSGSGGGESLLDYLKDIDNKAVPKIDEILGKIRDTRFKLKSLLTGPISSPIHEGITWEALFSRLGLKEEIVREVVNGNRDTDVNGGLGNKYNQTLHFDNGVVNYDNIINSVNVAKQNLIPQTRWAERCENVKKYRQVVKTVKIPVQEVREVESSCLRAYKEMVPIYETRPKYERRRVCLVVCFWVRVKVGEERVIVGYKEEIRFRSVRCMKTIVVQTYKTVQQITWEPYWDTVCNYVLQTINLPLTPAQLGEKLHTLQDFFSHSNAVEKDFNWANVKDNPPEYKPKGLITGWFWGWRTECGIGDTVCRFTSTVDVLSRAYGGDGELVLRMMKCKPASVDNETSHCRVNKDSPASFKGRQPKEGDGRLHYYIAREEAIEHSKNRAKEWCGIAGYGNDCSDIKIRRRISPK
jgi:RHS repeat-associated protein